VKQVFSHPWNVSPQEAIKLQEELRKNIVLKNDFSKVKSVAGADISFSRKSDKAYAAVIVFSLLELKKLEEQYTIGSLSFPYIPGLLTFREGPLLVETFKKIKIEPDVIIFDGQGIAHPKRLGLATHMGILLDKPTIGCAKSRLIGTYEEPRKKRSSYSLLKDEGEVIGAVLRTRENVSPVFISPGHKIDLKSSVEIVLKCLQGYRLPEPTRQAHLLVNRLRTENGE
jgi:deoxyribonuclease V